MAAGESATVFLETNLGTRLAVSFARATTIADLKRQVSAEHAASFPRFGPIDVTSFKVNRKGSLYQLTNSMAVEAAFRGIKGAWYLQVDAVPCVPVARKDVKCGTDDIDDTENACRLIGDCSQNISPLEESQGANLALGDSDTPLMNPQNKPDESAAPGSSFDPDVISTVLCNCQTSGSQGEMGQCDDGNTLLQESPDLDVAAGKDDGPVRIKQRDIIMEPRGKKLCREEDKDDEDTFANCDCGLTSVSSSRQDDGNKCEHLPKHNISNDCPKTKKICRRQDGPLSEVDVTYACTGDVSAESSENEIPEGQATLEKSQTQEKSASSLGNTEVENSTRSADDVNSLVSSCKHEKKSVTNETQSNSATPVFSLLVNKTEFVTIMEKHANDHVGDCSYACPEIEVSTSKTERASSEKHDSLIKKCSTVPAEQYTDSATLGFACPSAFDVELSEKESNKTEQSNRERHDLGENPFCSQAERWAAGVSRFEISNNISDVPPCVQSMKGDNSSDKEVKTLRSLQEPLIADGCNSESSNNGSSIPPCIESMKGINSSDKEVKAHRGVEEPRIAEVCNGEDRSKGIDAPHSVGTMKVDNSSVREVMAQKGEEKELCTGGVCNGERSNGRTDPLSCVETIKEINSSRANVELGEGERLNSKMTCKQYGTIERTQSTKSLLSDWQKSNTSEAKEGQRNLEVPSQNAGKCSDGTIESERIRVPQDDLTKEKTAPHNNYFGIHACIDLTSEDHYISKGKYEGATSTVKTEQEAYFQERHQRIAVRKVSMSRAKKVYGIR
ncbi:hypothetical protein ACP70R_033772 [Stipagrostis hirtigluma subsp. patula]